MNNQTIETLKKIAAKRVLGLSLTEHEKAMWTLYGDPSDAAYDNGTVGTPAHIGVDFAKGADRTANITVNINFNAPAEKLLDNIDANADKICDQIQEACDGLATKIDALIKAVHGGVKQ